MSKFLKKEEREEREKFHCSVQKNLISTRVPDRGCRRPSKHLLPPFLSPACKLLNSKLLIPGCMSLSAVSTVQCFVGATFLCPDPCPTWSESFFHRNLFTYGTSFPIPIRDRLSGGLDGSSWTMSGISTANIRFRCSSPDYLQLVGPLAPDSVVRRSSA